MQVISIDHQRVVAAARSRRRTTSKQKMALLRLLGAYEVVGKPILAAEPEFENDTLEDAIDQAIDDFIESGRHVSAIDGIMTASENALKLGVFEELESTKDSRPVSREAASYIAKFMSIPPVLGNALERCRVDAPKDDTHRRFFESDEANTFLLHLPPTWAQARYDFLRGQLASGAINHGARTPSLLADLDVYLSRMAYRGNLAILRFVAGWCETLGLKFPELSETLGGIEPQSTRDEWDVAQERAGRVLAKANVDGPLTHEDLR